MTAESNGRHIAAPCGGTATGARATINVRTRARARAVPYRPTYPQCAPRTVAYGYDALPRGPHRHRAQPLTASDGRPPRGTVRPRERPYRGRRNVRAGGGRAGRRAPPEPAPGVPVKRETASWPGLSSLAGRGIINKLNVEQVVDHTSTAILSCVEWIGHGGASPRRPARRHITHRCQSPDGPDGPLSPHLKLEQVGLPLRPCLPRESALAPLDQVKPRHRLRDGRQAPYRVSARWFQAVTRFCGQD